MLEEKSAKVSGLRKRFVWLYILAGIACLLTATVVSLAFISAFDAPEKDKNAVSDKDNQNDNNSGTTDDTNSGTPNGSQNQGNNPQGNTPGNNNPGNGSTDTPGGDTDNNTPSVIIPDNASVKWVQIPGIQTGTLVLVNADNLCNPENYSTQTGDLDIVKVRENRTTGTKNLQSVDTSVELSFAYVDALCKLADDLAASGITERRLMVYEGFLRSTDLSADEKQTGLSAILRMIDLSSGDNYQFDSQDKHSGEVFNWVLENCHKYGIILRYPAAKVPFTGVSASSRRFRYVGVFHAKYMKQMNYCLEEYIEEVKKYNFNTRLDLTLEEAEYSLYYVKESDAKQKGIPVPAGAQYEISGDNVGGYIVLIKK